MVTDIQLCIEIISAVKSVEPHWVYNPKHNKLLVNHYTGYLCCVCVWYLDWVDD